MGKALVGRKQGCLNRIWISVLQQGEHPWRRSGTEYSRENAVQYEPNRVRKRAEAHVKSEAYSNVEWSIEQAGKVLDSGSVGLADGLQGTALPERPIYRIYSMTKPLVSAVAVMLIDEGKLRLSDAVETHLPEFADMQVMADDGTQRAADTIMRVEHLFTHRSGLSYAWQQGTPLAKIYAERLNLSGACSFADLVADFASLPLAFEPGSRWHYSVSTDVLGYLVSVIEGKPIGEVLAERLFRPLGIGDTGFFVPESERHRVLPMFGDPAPDKKPPNATRPQKLHYRDPSDSYPMDNPEFGRGGTGLFSTLGDYAKAARFLADGVDASGKQIISRAGIEALWRNRIPEHQYPLAIGDLPMFGYGYGLGGRVMIRPGEALFYSTLGECGWSGAAATHFWIDPERDIVGVVMTQYLDQKLRLGDDICGAFYQSLV